MTLGNWNPPTVIKHHTVYINWKSFWDRFNIDTLTWQELTLVYCFLFQTAVTYVTACWVISF